MELERYGNLSPKGTNLRQANLSQANLRKANLKDSIFEPPKLEGAIMPDGTIYQEGKQKHNLSRK